MGGYCALALARRAPERIVGMVLAGSRASADTFDRRWQRDDQIAALRARDVEMVEYPHGQVRAVTHYGVTAADIEKVVAKMARVPVQAVSSDDRTALKQLDTELRAVIFGQDPAIDDVTSAIKLARSGLRDHSPG